MTKGVDNIHNIIRIELFRHYEQSITTYKLLMLTHTNKSKTELGIFEVMDTSNPNFIVTSVFYENWTMDTILFKDNKPCIVALVRIDNDLILMSKDEFFALQKQGGCL